MPGRIYDELLELALDQHGFLRTEDVRDAGFDPKLLVDYQRRGLAKRCAQGVYRLTAVPQTNLDEYMQAAMWPAGIGVLSHETALDLYELCDVNPAQIDITVPQRYRTHRQVPAIYRLHRSDLPAEHQTQFRGLPIVTPFQAILGGIEVNQRSDLIEQAIETATRQSLITTAEAAHAREHLATNRSRHSREQ